MKLIRFASRLYPAAWRARYGVEFEALLEDIGPGWRDLWNVLAGALKMQMTTSSFWKVVPALAAAGALVAGITSFTMRPAYESAGVIRVKAAAETPNAGLDLAMAQHLDRLRTYVLSRTTLAHIITEEGLYPNEAQAETLEGAVARMQRDVRIEPVGVPGERAPALSLAFRYQDPSTAQRVTRKLMAEMVHDSELAARDSSTPATLEVLDAARTRSIGPNRPVIIAVGLAAGLLLGCLYAVRRWWRVLLSSAMVGALLAVLLDMASSGYRPVSYPGGVLPRLAVLGFLVGLLLGLAAVLVRQGIRVAAFAAGGALLGMAASLALSFALPVRYQSQAVLRVRGADVPSGVVRMATSRDALAGVIQRNGLYPGEPIGQAMERIRRDLVVVQPLQRTFVIVRFTCGDPNQARWVVTGVITAIMRENRREQDAATGPDSPLEDARLVSVLDPPSLPTTPFSPNRGFVALLGLVAGFLLGPLAFWFRRRTAAA